MEFNKEAIKTLIDSGITLSIPYKDRLDMWFDDPAKFKGFHGRYLVVVGTHHEYGDFNNAYEHFTRLLMNPGRIQSIVYDENPGLFEPEDWEKLEVLVEKYYKDNHISWVDRWPGDGEELEQ